MLKVLRFKKRTLKLTALILAFLSLLGVFAIYSQSFKELAPSVFATETECRNAADLEIDTCEQDKFDENMASCISSCEETILDENISNYSNFSGTYASDLCQSYCEYGYDYAPYCQAYASDFYEGGEESYAFAGCFDTCVATNGSEYEWDCYDACYEGDASSCVLYAGDLGLGEAETFCSELENYTGEDFLFCEELENYDGSGDAYTWCEDNGHYDSFSAYFCAEASSTDCETECLADGGDPSVCDDVTGICQYLPAATDSEVPTFTFDSITWTGFANLSSVKGSVSDESNIDYIQVANTPEGEWINCTCSDGACDSSDEDFVCEDVDTPAGETTLYFKAADIQGNVHTIENYHQETVTVDEEPTDDVVYSLDMNSTTLTDLSSFAVTGTHIGGTPSVTSGYNGAALNYAGTVHSQIKDNMAVYDFSEGGSFAAEAYVYSENFAESIYSRVISKFKNDNSSVLWSLTIEPEGKVMCQMDTSIGFISQQTDDALTDGEWHQIACNWDGDYIQIIIDNTVSKEFDYSGQNATFTNSFGLMTIAGEPNNWDQRAFNGLIDDVKIYKNSQEYLTPDAIPPQVTINKTYENLTQITDNTPTFTGTVTDEIEVVGARYLFTDLPGVAYDSEVTFDDLAWQSFNPDDGVWDEATETFTVTAPTPLDEGEQYLYIIAEDIYGNESYHNSVGYFYSYSFDSNSVVATKRFIVNALDEAAPEIHGQLVIPDPTIDRSPYLQGYVIDSNSDIVSNIADISYKIDDGEWTPITPIDGTYDSYKENFSLQLETLEIGNHTLYISAEDAAGNSTIDDDSNYSDEFEILPFQEADSRISTKSEEFSSHDYHDLLYTDGVWGNGYARLRQNLDITPEEKYAPGPEVYGYAYGDLSSAYTMSESIDDIGIWFITNSNTLYYYNTTNDSITDYGVILADDVVDIFEFEYNEDIYLILSYSNDSYIIDLNNSPENPADDTTINWGSFFTTNELGSWGDIQLDTRGGNLSIYAIGNTADDNNIIHIDLNNTPTILTDDTFTTWGSADGLTGQTNYTAFYFDQTNNNTYAFSYTYGLHSCDDNGTPTVKADDTCFSQAWDIDGVPNKVFSTDFDSEANVLWTGGDRGLHFVDLNDTADPSDDVWTLRLGPSDIDYEDIEHIQVIPSDYPVGQEIIFTTRSASIRGIEVNFTPEDTYDDTLYEYFIDQENGSNIFGGGMGFTMTDENSLWLNIPREGLYMFALDRSFATQNVIESLPNPPSNILEVNNITLSEVNGYLGSPVLSALSLNNELLNGQDYSTSDLYQYPGVDFYISNDGGQNWRLIKQNETVNLDTDNYLVKFKAVLKNLSGETPVLDYMSFNYAAYNTPEDEVSTLQITNPASLEVWESITINLFYVDTLGFVDDVNKTISLEVRNAANPTQASSCLTIPSQVSLVNGIGSVSATATCAGAFQIYGVNSNDSSEYAFGNTITVPDNSEETTDEIQDQTSSPASDEDSCGNGVIDDGEECDGGVIDLACTDYSQFTGGELSCNNDCTLNTDSCFVVTVSTDDSNSGQAAIETNDELKTNESTEVNEETGNYPTIALLPLLALELIALTQSLQSGLIVLTIPSMIAQIPAFLMRVFILLLRLLGIKKAGREIGYVYDAVTKEPLSLAVVRIFNKDKTLVNTEVTNSFGVFHSDIPEGEYIVTATKANYQFPSKIISTNLDSPIKNIYHGELQRFDNDELQDISIPMDPSNADFVMRRSPMFNISSTVLSYIINLLNLVGLVLSIMAVRINPSTINWIVLLGYILIILTMLYRYFFGYRDMAVRNRNSNQPVGDATVYLYKTGSDQALDKRISKADGTYRFVASNGIYDISAAKGDKTSKISGINNDSDKVVRISKEIDL